MLIGNPSADIIRRVHPSSSCCWFGPAQATRCQAGCNIKQQALTLNGRTPATKATTKKLPLTAFPLFSASCMTPAPSWKKIAVTFLRTRRRPLKRAQKQLSQNKHRRADIDDGAMEEGPVQMAVNLNEVFLPGEAFEEWYSKHWSEGQGIKLREGAARWPRTMFGMFRKYFPETTKQPGTN